MPAKILPRSCQLSVCIQQYSLHSAMSERDSRNEEAFCIVVCDLRTDFANWILSASLPHHTGSVYSAHSVPDAYSWLSHMGASPTGGLFRLLLQQSMWDILYVHWLRYGNIRANKIVNMIWVCCDQCDSSCIICVCVLFTELFTSISYVIISTRDLTIVVENWLQCSAVDVM